MTDFNEFFDDADEELALFLLLGLGGSDDDGDDDARDFDPGDWDSSDWA